MIKIKDLKIKYNEKLVLNGINIEIKQGEYVAIMGDNGSGKSTLALALNGILEPFSGAIYIDNIDTRNEEDIFEVRKKVGIVFQNPDNQIVSSVVEEDVAFGPNNLGIVPEKTSELVKEALENVGLQGYEKNYTNKLSGGQKQRLAIAGVLAMKPKCIILDEATSMLDKEGAKQILEIVKKLNKEQNITIIHITHEKEEALLANRIIFLKEGTVGADDSFCPEEQPVGADDSVCLEEQMEPTLSAKNITYTYDKKTRHSKKALDNVNFSINKGETFGIVGKTGAGKSTLISLLNGLKKDYTRRNMFKRRRYKKAKKSAKKSRSGFSVSRKPII